jgi:transposase InsO family protein
VVNKLRSDFAVEKICDALSISKSGYYKWRKKPYSKRDESDKVLLEFITQIHFSSNQRFGSPRIVAKLREQGQNCNHKRVERLMKENNICSKAARKFKVTTNSNHDKNISPNLLRRDFNPPAANHVWCSDITYIRTLEGWLYLAIVIDLYSRKVVGWSMSKSMSRHLVIDSFNMAWEGRGKPEGLIYHSDRGSQYASNDFRNLLGSCCVSQSMSRAGDCWDNACSESFFASLKKEEVYMTPIYPTRAIAKDCIFEYIEVFYNLIDLILF